MPWWCRGCGERRYGEICKCGEREAERIPPLDGFMELELRHRELWGFWCGECEVHREFIGKNARRNTFIGVRTGKRLVWWPVCSYCGSNACGGVIPPLEFPPPTAVGQVINKCKREIIPECPCERAIREAREKPRPHVLCPSWDEGHDHKDKTTQKRCELYLIRDTIKRLKR